MSLVATPIEYYGTDVLSKHFNKLQIKPEHQAGARANWSVYFGEGTLENLQMLCEDLDIDGDLSSKHKCKVALHRVNVNIPQFLKAMGTPGLEVVKFTTRRELVSFTMSGGKKKRWVFRNSDIPKGCPLRQLLKELY